jgi:hypothetical protein
MITPLAYLPGAEMRYFKARRVDPSRPEPIPVQALRLALADEKRAQVFYTMVLERHGPHQPFLSIVEAERRHFEGLAAIALRWGVPIPDIDWRREITVPDAFADCCAIGVHAEIENYEMYDHFLAYPLPPELVQAFKARREASSDRHLPTFIRCAGPEALERAKDAREARERDRFWWGVVAGAGAVVVASTLLRARRGRV